MSYYHYCCVHSFERIGERGALQPNLPGAEALSRKYGPIPPMVWLTDLSWPIAKVLGLRRIDLLCDRTTHRYSVDDESTIQPWMDLRKTLPETFTFDLEVNPGVLPRHWFVSLEPVPVTYSPIGGAS